MSTNVDIKVGMSIRSLLRDKAPLSKAVVVTDPKADVSCGHMGVGMTFSPKTSLLQTYRARGVLSKNSTLQAKGLRSALACNHFDEKPQQRNKAIFRGTRRGR